MKSRINNSASSKKYPPDSAGRIMVANVPVIHEDLSVAEIEKLLIKKTKEFDTINYIYIVDNENRLTGAVSIKEVFRSPKNTIAKELSPRRLVYAHAHTDKEKIAMLSLKYGLKSIPVVAKNQQFLGVVQSDDILRILHDEHTEDLFRMSGITHKSSYDNVFEISFSTSLKHRLPWLIVGLGGGLLAAGIVSRFEEILAAHIILAAFIPLIVYMCGAISSQMQTFIIRDLALNPHLPFAKYLAKQTSIILVISLTISLLLYGASLALYQMPDVSFVLGIALFSANLTTLFTGLILPYAFSKMRLDPANISGPIAAIIQDVLAILTYFLIAMLILYK